MNIIDAIQKAGPGAHISRMGRLIHVSCLDIVKFTKEDVTATDWEVVEPVTIEVGDIVRDSKDCCRPTECQVIGAGSDDFGHSLYAFQNINDKTCVCNVSEGATLIRKGKPKREYTVEADGELHFRPFKPQAGYTVYVVNKGTRMTLEPMDETQPDKAQHKAHEAVRV